jgi:hypothetical protein
LLKVGRILLARKGFPGYDWHYKTSLDREKVVCVICTHMIISRREKEHYRKVQAMNKLMQEWFPEVHQADQPLVS